MKDNKPSPTGAQRIASQRNASHFPDLWLKSVVSSHQTECIDTLIPGAKASLDQPTKQL